MKKARFLFLLLIGLGACQRQVPLRVYVPRGLPALLACVVEHGGPRGVHRLDVELVWGDSSDEGLELLSRAEVDLAVTGLPSFVAKFNERQDLRIVAETMSSTRNLVLAMLRRNDIRTLKQLTGKRVGFVPGTSSEIFIEHFLLTEGVNLGSIKKIPLELDELKDRFVKNELDAIIIWEPELSRLKLANPKMGIIEFDGFGHESKGVLVGALDTLAKHKNLIDELLKTWISAEKWSASNPEEARHFYQKCLGVEEAAMPYLSSALRATRAEPMLTHSLKHAYERNRDWLVLRKNYSQGLIPEFRQAVDTSFMLRVRPSAVTIGGGASK